MKRNNDFVFSVEDGPVGAGVALVAGEVAHVRVDDALGKAIDEVLADDGLPVDADAHVAVVLQAIDVTWLVEVAVFGADVRG